MQYLLLISIEENAMSATEREPCYAILAQIAQALYTTSIWRPLYSTL
jgi:hypothetical protein